MPNITTNHAITYTNTFIGFIKPHGRQVFPDEKEVKVLLLTRRVCFPVVF